MPSRVAFVGCIAVAAAGLAGAVPASGQDYARRGFYLGADVLGGIYTELDDRTEDAARDRGITGVNVDTDTAVGFDLYGGYRLHPHFAIEAEFELLSEADIDLKGYGSVARIESWNLTANAKGIVLPGRIQPFVVAGLGVLEAELKDTTNSLGTNDTQTGFTGHFGGGVDVYVTEHIVVSISANYLVPTGDVSDLDYVSFGGGVQYRF